MGMNATEGADPFGTARLRRGVLDAWGAGPARFREDANAEEDLVLGGYRDRLVVELAQNAADAAARAGVPGRLRLTLRPATPGVQDTPAVLAAANTGAPLDATGVESLSTLRASAKRDGHESAVGRFGVGFAAVLAVSDEPAVIGRHGGVRWSLPEARDLARQAAVGSPGLGRSCAAATATYRCSGSRCPPRAPRRTDTTRSSSSRCATAAPRTSSAGCSPPWTTPCSSRSPVSKRSSSKPRTA
ncbi:hypothetical protein Sfulv_34310 [Streptomyces fulvorobeus]|uniref:Molecular chaperone Hsp90 n=1 Tax=Streptomyces fulvorobeus TaxID=284028 RepID=A0A7J0C7X6_9ACTN|nr:hypothetical protein Sfulv_34310 [Streptomyces fulvorobeus]